tara:strand:+ start:4172 stop:4384 length:213 start_codon:yes stop_codon:yes gene_type:complete
MMDLVDVVLKEIRELENIPDEHQFVFNNIKMENKFDGVISFNAASPQGFYTLIVEFELGKGIVDIIKKVV